MNSGSNHPAGTGGRGRKRRRGRRGGQGTGTQTGTQAQDGLGQGNQNLSPASQGKPATQGKPTMKRQFKPKPPARKSVAEANGNGNGNSAKRILRTVVNHKTPDASVYSAPMDHSYRSLRQEGNAGRPGYEAMPVGENISS